MELTLWWVEEKDWQGNWIPEHGPYVGRYKAEEEVRKIDAASGWHHREPMVRVNGITIKGEEAY